ncbi:ABC transporter permease [Chryseosolibacter indicus]|uniref:FtsX-like permease family protein n=1 Tax=Chryseosolibacter indicus TaxID=2782351 RepID=A0ABS5VRC6_9BACT|nr:FtsX-like permease family protein [Chryseosolibacter indicus]MBT1704005.1 FtsX-like permease family protein [Chryseosolibacter indicus]
MNLFSLVWNYLKARPLNTVLNIILLSLGIAVITILLIFNKQLEENITRNAKGIDLVVGAKGSPLQLILCNIFHMDFPTGNINLAEAEKIAKNRLVKKAIPLALGDSYQGFRIIGTTIDYPQLYEAEVREGGWYKEVMEVTIGANVAAQLQLRLNDEFTSTHGLSADGHSHDAMHFKVKGILQKSQSVIDNLIFTSVQSIWKVHEEHEEEEHGEEEKAHDYVAVTNSSLLVPGVEAGDTTKEITSMLIRYRSPMGAIQLPRFVNSQSTMQAASPAFETARLFSIMGVGLNILNGFAFVLIFISGLSIFIALYNSLKERRYDLAIMRSMGATKQKLFVSVILEGVLLTFFGALAGLILGHLVVTLLGNMLEETQKAGINGLVFYVDEWIILVGSLLLGLVSSVIPAFQAYRTDISKVLAGN